MNQHNAASESTLKEALEKALEALGFAADVIGYECHPKYEAEMERRIAEVRQLMQEACQQ